LTLSSFHPAMKAVMNMALTNAQTLNNKCIEYRASRLNSNEFEWLPSRKNSNPVSYALGIQICTHDLLLLDMPISCTDKAIIEYQAKVSANVRKYYDQNTCPYCGNTLQSKFLSKECYICGKIRRP